MSHIKGNCLILLTLNMRGQRSIVPKRLLLIRHYGRRYREPVGRIFCEGGGP